MPASWTLAVAHLAHHTRSAARLDEGALAPRSPEQDPRGGPPRRASAVPQDGGICNQETDGESLGGTTTTDPLSRPERLHARLTTRVVRRTLLPTYMYHLSRRRAPPPALKCPGGCSATAQVVQSSSLLSTVESERSSCGTALARRGSPPRGSCSGLLEARAL